MDETDVLVVTPREDEVACGLAEMGAETGEGKNGCDAGGVNACVCEDGGLWLWRLKAFGLRLDFMGDQSGVVSTGDEPTGYRDVGRLADQRGHVCCVPGFEGVGLENSGICLAFSAGERFEGDVLETFDTAVGKCDGERDGGA